MKLFATFFLVFVFIYAGAQQYPQHYFRSPLDIPLQLAANFGELRPDHFHMGLDIRTQSRENLPVYAAADGYISRIVVEEGGFGKAIFITHPNGYTSVYGHLNSFFKALSDYIKAVQYERQSWEQDLILQPGLFTVSKGQFIAFSGNTGASAGPHLHFEIRNTATEENINPELFGLDLADNIPPVIHNIYWYDRRYSTYQTLPQPIAIVKKNNSYSTVNTIVKSGSPLISLGISAEDKNNASPFLFGVYKAELLMDDSLIFSFKLDTVSYNETRYVNACIDYKTYALSKKYIQHLSILPGNKLAIFPNANARGLIILADTLPHKITINLSDVYSNNTNLVFQVQYNSLLEKNMEYPLNAKAIIPEQENKITGNYFEATFAKTAFYDAVPFQFSEQQVNAINTVSPIINFQNTFVPVHNKYDIKIKTNLAANDTLRNKTIMQFTTAGKRNILKGNWIGNQMQGSLRKLGTWQLVVDTVPPAIKITGKLPLKFTALQKMLQVKCEDNFDEIENFTATLDGQWLMFEKKGNSYTYHFDEHCTKGAHQLLITATDVAGNISQQNFSFTKE